MSKLTTKQIQVEALSVLAEYPKGVRWSELMKALSGKHPETPFNTIHGSLHKLLASGTNTKKIAKGIYVLNENAGALEGVPVESTLQAIPGPGYQESDFYQPFADWLRDELEEANHAVPVGGNILKGKWGTPDVIGVLKPAASDLIKFAPQIVSAEIKIDVNAPVVAFGQAVAYRLFSHKSYMVMPSVTAKDDISKLDALAAIYGVGLVTFTLNPAIPDFSLRVRALPSEPDMFYVNEMAKRLQASAPKTFDELF